MRLRLISGLIGSGVACANGPAIDRGPSVPSPKLATAWCDDDMMTNVAFRSRAANGIRIEYLPGTAAERDITTILSLRIAARDNIARALGLREVPSITVWLAPNRLAAAAHNIGGGMASAADARIEALYLDAPDTYEHVRYGHEVAHVVAFRLDPVASPITHLKFVDEGLAEFFDQSGRDLHRAYANELVAEDRPPRATSFDERDVYGFDYAKQGSFMQTLLAIDADPVKLRRFYVGCRLRWRRGASPIDVPGLERMIDASLRNAYGISLEAFRSRWKSDLDRAIAQGPMLVDDADEQQLAALLALRESAIRDHDPALLRATFEGFRCDEMTDAARWQYVQRVLERVTPGTVTLLRAYDNGITNYPSAILVFERHAAGRIERLRAYAERYAIGWRFRWVDGDPRPP